MNAQTGRVISFLSAEPRCTGLEEKGEIAALSRYALRRLWIQLSSSNRNQTSFFFNSLLRAKVGHINLWEFQDLTSWVALKQGGSATRLLMGWLKCEIDSVYLGTSGTNFWVFISYMWKVKVPCSDVCKTTGLESWGLRPSPTSSPAWRWHANFE